MFHLGRRAAIVAATAILGSGLVGGAALAASTQASDASNVAAATPNGASSVTSERIGHRSILGGLFEESAKYLGIAPKDLRARVAGTSLGAIADTTAGKTRSGLVADLVSFANNAIDKALADGRITQSRADALKRSVPERIAKFVDHVRKEAHHHAGARSYLGGLMKDARDYLGLSQKDIATQLRAGKSLGDIAAATSGKSRQGLIDAIMKDANSKIDAAVQRGAVTATQATELRTKVLGLVTKIVDHAGHAAKP